MNIVYRPLLKRDLFWEIPVSTMMVLAALEAIAIYVWGNTGTVSYLFLPVALYFIIRKLMKKDPYTPEILVEYLLTPEYLEV